MLPSCLDGHFVSLLHEALREFLEARSNVLRWEASLRQVPDNQRVFAESEPANRPKSCGGHPTQSHLSQNFDAATPAVSSACDVRRRERACAGSLADGHGAQDAYAPEPRCSLAGRSPMTATPRASCLRMPDGGSARALHLSAPLINQQPANKTMQRAELDEASQ